MTPYATFFYFGVLAFIVGLPGLLIGYVRGYSRLWVLLATVIMLVIQFANELFSPTGPYFGQLGFLILYGALQWIVAKNFLRRRVANRSKLAFYSAIALGIAPLIASRVAGMFETSIGFAGLSYAMFRSLDLLIQIEDGRVTSLEFTEFFAFVFFFPTLSSGPIDRFTRFRSEFVGSRTRAEFFKDLDEAVHKIFTGFFYKFIIAFLIDRYVLGKAIYKLPRVPAELLYVYGYSLYLFFDFAGYCSFAIGASYFLGIKTPENFNKPFLAKNIREFWSRWHITLSTWFRDHVYMRFMLSVMKSKIIKDPNKVSIAGFFVSFGLMGVWHGASWHYIIYGLYHAVLMSGYEIYSRWNKKKRWIRPSRTMDILSIILTFHAVCFGFWLFSGHVFSIPERTIK